MRKLVISVNISLDGIMAGPGDELDWHFERWSAEMTDPLCEQLSKADTILLGRNTYDAMAAFWPGAPQNPYFPRKDIAYAEMMNNHIKVVFSNSLRPGGWKNTRIIKGDLHRQVLQLKSEPGKDIIIYGSGRLISSLLPLGLIDEYALWVHPVILGRGKHLFGFLPGKNNLQLQKIRCFPLGVILLNYKANVFDTSPVNKIPAFI